MAIIITIFSHNVPLIFLWFSYGFPMIATARVDQGTPTHDKPLRSPACLSSAQRFGLGVGEIN